MRTSIKIDRNFRNGISIPPENISLALQIFITSKSPSSRLVAKKSRQSIERVPTFPAGNSREKAALLLWCSRTRLHLWSFP